MALSDAAPFVTAGYALSDLTDSVGGLTLTNNNSVTFAAGKLGNAASFAAASSQTLSRADAAALTTGGAKYYFRCWLRFSAGAGVGGNVTVPACKLNANRAEWVLRHVGTGRLRIYVYSGNNFSGETILEDANFGVVVNNTWYRVAWWHDPDADVLGLSINGVRTTTAYTAGVHANDGNFQLGGQAPYSEHIDGLIDDAVVVKGYILSEAEEAEDYDAGNAVAFADWAGGGGGAAASHPFNRRRNKALRRM